MGAVVTDVPLSPDVAALRPREVGSCGSPWHPSLPPNRTLELCWGPTGKFWLLLQKVEDPGKSFIRSQCP